MNRVGALLRGVFLFAVAGGLAFAFWQVTLAAVPDPAPASFDDLDIYVQQPFYMVTAGSALLGWMMLAALVALAFSQVGKAVQPAPKKRRRSRFEHKPVAARPAEQNARGADYEVFDAGDGLEDVAAATNGASSGGLLASVKSKFVRQKVDEQRSITLNAKK